MACGARFDNAAALAAQAPKLSVGCHVVLVDGSPALSGEQSTGIAVSHLDSHKHTHMFPVVLRGMLRAARNCEVRAIRNPFEPLVFAKIGSWTRQFQLRILQLYCASFRNELTKARMVTPDGCIGIAATGGLTLAAFQCLIERLPEGTWELVSHPGYTDVELGEIKTRLRASREKGLAILTSAAAKESLHRKQIGLISYRDLAAA